MNQREVVDTLLDQARIEPGFTELVWQKLEEENREFFKAYYLRLMVKHQINEFNRLLEQQVQLMHQMDPAGVASMPTSNGSHISPLHRNSACYAPEHARSTVKAENIQDPVGLSLPNAFANGGSLLHPSMHSAVEMTTHASRIDVPPNLLSAQGLNVGLIQGINGAIIKSETGYSGSPPYIFDSDGNVAEVRPPIVDASGASYPNVESNAQPLSEPILDADTSSFGFLGQIPRNFSLSDLTADFSQSSDILESYPRSPFLATDSENFLDSRDRGEHQGDNRRLGTISEGLSYEDFGSD